MKNTKDRLKLQGTPLCRHWPLEQYQRAQLNSWADILLGIPYGLKGPLANRTIDKPLPALNLSDSGRWEIAIYLRLRAEQLKAASKRGRPRESKRQARIALDYLVTCELKGKAASAEVEMCEAWKIKKTTLTDANRIYKHYAQKELNRIELANREMARTNLLEAISQELRSPEKSAE